MAEFDRKTVKTQLAAYSKRLKCRFIRLMFVIRWTFLRVTQSSWEPIFVNWDIQRYKVLVYPRVIG